MRNSPALRSSSLLDLFPIRLGSNGRRHTTPPREVGDRAGSSAPRHPRRERARRVVVGGERVRENRVPIPPVATVRAAEHALRCLHGGRGGGLSVPLPWKGSAIGTIGADAASPLAGGQRLCRSVPTVANWHPLRGRGSCRGSRPGHVETVYSPTEDLAEHGSRSTVPVSTCPGGVPLAGLGSAASDRGSLGTHDPGGDARVDPTLRRRSRQCGLWLTEHR